MNEHPRMNELRQLADEIGVHIYGLKVEQALRELIEAIDARWEGESDRKRANAISPRMEEAIAAARPLLIPKYQPKPGEVSAS